MNNFPKVIVIVGPTCSGKTDLSLLLSEKIPSEIISADSRQIYKLLSIGTAKPSEDELAKVKHHFIDFLNPDVNYNVSRYEKEALNVIAEITHNGRTPIIAGGSGLYIKAIVDGIFDAVDTDEEYREYLLAKRKEFGNEYLFKELQKVDPVTASKLLPQNWKRIIRALEVYKLSGKPIWKLQQEYKRTIKYNFLQFGINWERKVLYENINFRVDEMIKNGLVEEVENILKLGYAKNINALNTVGYKEIIEYLDGKITLDRAIELIKRNTRRYAKRQLTWFGKDKRIKWFDVKNKKEFPAIAEEILKTTST